MVRIQGFICFPVFQGQVNIKVTNILGPPLRAGELLIIVTGSIMNEKIVAEQTLVDLLTDGATITWVS